MSEQAERRVGNIIGGKWRVDALLGSGSMAAVYAVTHRNGARAALKILHPTLCTDPAVCERFLGEGYLANSVKHTGIVRVLDDGVTDDGCVFLTMDLLEGDTLEELRQKRGNKIPMVEALDLADKLMDVLSAVHAAGIIHRDLKPQNVFVCNDGVLKLLDFGVARVFDRTPQSKLSMFGLVLGTPSFMSPEQAVGSRDKVDHRSDIWSFGATLFTALTGETVHLGANIQAKLLAAATVKARSIAMVMPSLPAGIAAAIDTALRFKKEDRWQSCEVMRRAFRDARDAAGLGRPAEPVRAFDMSLDESTHRDTGGADGLPNFGGPFDGEKTQRLASDAPAGGPGGTFIGMGSSPPPPFNPQAGRGSGGSGWPPAKSSAPPPVPMRGRMPSHGPPTPGVPFQSKPPGPAPAGVIRRPPGSDPGIASGGSGPYPAIGSPMRSSRPDGQEGSIPAYGNTLNFGADESGPNDIDPRDLGMRRKSSVGVWLMAVLLAAAAMGGIAFFAVKRGPLFDPSSGSGDLRTPATAVSSATLPTPPTSLLPSPSIASPPSTLAMPVDPGAGAGPLAFAKDASVATPTPLAVTPATPAPPVRVGGLPPRVLGGGGGHGPRTPARPTSTATSDPPPATPTNEPKAPPPPLAPDPFGTPE